MQKNIVILPGDGIGPEIMAPLTNAVSLVYGEKCDFKRLQPVEELIRHQALWGQIEKVQIIPVQSRQYAGGLLCPEARVVKGSAYSVDA